MWPSARSSADRRLEQPGVIAYRCSCSIPLNSCIRQPDGPGAPFDQTVGGTEVMKALAMDAKAFGMARLNSAQTDYRAASAMAGKTW